MFSKFFREGNKQRSGKVIRQPDPLFVSPCTLTPKNGKEKRSLSDHIWWKVTVLASAMACHASLSERNKNTLEGERKKQREQRV